MAAAKQRGGGSSTRAAQPAAAADQQKYDDAAKAARVKRLVLQTGALVAGAVVAAWFELISNQVALMVIVAMYVTIRVLA